MQIDLTREEISTLADLVIAVMEQEQDPIIWSIDEKFLTLCGLRMKLLKLEQTK